MHWSYFIFLFYFNILYFLLAFGKSFFLQSAHTLGVRFWLNEIEAMMVPFRSIKSMAVPFDRPADGAIQLNSLAVLQEQEEMSSDQSLDSNLRQD